MADQKSSKIPILCLGLPRSGSASLGQALRILGYPVVHHGTEMGTHDPLWEDLSVAADRTFPTLPTYDATRAPYTRSDWDALLGGRYDAVTDVFAYYALSLLIAYPEAKVILVERDINAWQESWNQQKSAYFRPVPFALYQLLKPLTGILAFETSKKFIYGWIGSNSRADVFDKAREANLRHYRDVRAVLAKRDPTLSLEFKLADGWGPLCRFLDKDIPDEPFPRVNERKQHMEMIRKRRLMALCMLAPWLIGAGAVGGMLALLWVHWPKYLARE